MDGASLPEIKLRREVLLGASARALWPLVSNTSRMNRSLGLPAMALSDASAGDFTAKVEASLYGLKLSWREPPFEWVEGRYYRVAREFDRGPFRRFELAVELGPSEAGTRVTVDSTFTPRNAVGSFLARHAAGRRAVDDLAALLRRFDAALSEQSDAFPARRTKSAPHAPALAEKAQALHAAPVERGVASRLLHFIDHAYDDELGRMRPFELAEQWGSDRLKTLLVFLHATKAGLLDLTWEILCPNCAAPQVKTRSLRSVGKGAHCASCASDFTVSFDESVEARFSVNPSVRAVETRAFCVGSPAHTPFAAAQLPVAAGSARDVDVELGPESYVLRDLRSKAAVRLRPDAGGASRLDVDFSRAEKGLELGFKPGHVRLALAPLGVPALARLERENWKERAATAALVTSLQEFRDLFSSEVLAPGVDIGVKTLTVMFSDLKDSTALYETIGTASAYAVVRDHFEYLFAIIKDNNGAVVKTIGDAVMAVFATARDAVAAGFEIQRRLGELNRKIAPRAAVVVKLGVHRGPAIAINADDVLDYFGTTVNIAARVQHESNGGDVVVTRAVAEDAGVAEMLAALRFKDEPFEIKLKGLSDVFKLRRLTPEPPHA